MEISGLEKVSSVITFPIFFKELSFMKFFRPIVSDTFESLNTKSLALPVGLRIVL